MPTRIIRDGILTSERINMLSANAELFYRRLMSVTDDYGRFPNNLTLLRASCYPLKLDSVKEDSISKHLAECVDAKLIVLYTVADKAYLELQDFGQRINGKPKFPGPADGIPKAPRDSPGFPGIPRLGGDVVEDEDGGGEAPAPELPKEATAAALACKAFMAAGIAGVNPEHPDLRAAIAEGTTLAEFEATAREMVGKGKRSFAYVIAAIRRRKAETAAPVHPAKPRTPEYFRADPKAIAAREARAGGNAALIGELVEKLKIGEAV